MLKGKNYDATSKKQSDNNQFHSQISNKSEKYWNYTAEKNRSNKKLENADNLRKDSKKNFIEKFSKPCFSNTDEQHSVKRIRHEEICTSGNKETKNNRIILGENKTFSETSKNQHISSTENIFEEDQVQQSPIMLPLDVLKGKTYDTSSEKHSEKTKFYSQISNKSEENYSNHNTEKNSSSKKQVTKIEFRSPVSVENHWNNKLEKDSKENSIEKFWEPIFNDTEVEHSVESIQHEEFCSSDKKPNYNGITLVENKLKLGFSETSRKQNTSGKKQKFKEDQTEQTQMILSSDMLKEKNCNASNEKELKKNKFNSWINIKSEEYSNHSTEK